MSTADKIKDEVSTRSDAVKEDLKNSDKKSDTGSKVLGDLTNSKEEVKTDSYLESAKNTVIDAYESVKEAVGSALGTAEEKK
ncbi:LEA1 [Acrasis kona]|uniref:LEA1 n=1 Tax=Acrasis kona TaxID=1008807 RepID=A0AAW2YKI5_9EUKA